MGIKNRDELRMLPIVKQKQLQNSDLPENSRRQFSKVDADIIKKWKNGVIMTMLNYAPEKFRFALTFTNWEEAMRHLDQMHREKNGR